MIYSEAPPRKMHNFFWRGGGVPVVRCFVSWETRLLILLKKFPRKIEGLDDCLFRAIQKLGNKTHSLVPVKVGTIFPEIHCAEKKTQLLANQLKIKQASSVHLNSHTHSLDKKLSSQSLANQSCPRLQCLRIS